MRNVIQYLLANKRVGYPLVDRTGKELSVLEWAELFNDDSYRLIKRDEIEPGMVLETLWDGVTTFDTAGFNTYLVDEGMATRVVKYSGDNEAYALELHADGILEVIEDMKRYRRECGDRIEGGLPPLVDGML